MGEIRPVLYVSMYVGFWGDYLLENIYLNYSKKIEYCQVTGTGIGDGKRNRKVPLVPEDDSIISWALPP